MLAPIPPSAPPRASLSNPAFSQPGMLISGISGLLVMLGFLLTSSFRGAWADATDYFHQGAHITIGSLLNPLLSVLPVGMMVVATVLAIVGFFSKQTLSWLNPLMLTLAAAYFFSYFHSYSLLLGDTLIWWGTIGMLAGGIITFADRAGRLGAGAAAPQKISHVVPILGIVSASLCLIAAFLPILAGNGSSMARFFGVSDVSAGPLGDLLSLLSATLPLAAMALGGLVISILAFFVRPSAALSAIYLGLVIPGFAIVFRRSTYYLLYTALDANTNIALILLASLGFVTAALVLAHQVDYQAEYRAGSLMRLLAAMLVAVGGLLTLADFSIPWGAVLDPGQTSGSSGWSILINLLTGPGFSLPLMLSWLFPWLLTLVAVAFGCVAFLRAPGLWVSASALILVVFAFLIYNLSFTSPDQSILRIAAISALVGAMLLALDHSATQRAGFASAPKPAGSSLAPNQIALLIALVGAVLIIAGYLLPWAPDLLDESMTLNGWSMVFRPSDSANAQEIISLASFALLPVLATLATLLLGFVSLFVRGKATLILAGCALAVAAGVAVQSFRLDLYARGSIPSGYGQFIMQAGLIALDIGALALFWTASEQRALAPVFSPAPPGPQTVYPYPYPHP